MQNLWKRDANNEDSLTSWTSCDDWNEQGCEDGGRATSDEISGENVPLVPIPGSSIGLLVSGADCCSEAGSVVRQGWGFPGSREPGGVSFWPGLGDTASSGIYRALSASFAFLHGYMVPFLKTTNVTSLLCILSDWFYADEKLDEGIKYFNNTINKLDLIAIRRILLQQLQNTHFTPFKDAWSTCTNWSVLGHETKQISKNCYHREQFSDHIMIMLEFSNREKNLYVWNLRNSLKYLMVQKISCCKREGKTPEVHNRELSGKLVDCYQK